MTAAAVGSLAAGDPAPLCRACGGAGLVVGALCIARLGRAARLPRGPAVQAGAGRIHGGHRRDHGRQPARQAHRHRRRRRLVRHPGRLRRRPPGRGAWADPCSRRRGAHVAARREPRCCPRSPMPLVGMLLAAATVAVFDLETHGIAVVGQIPAGFRPLPCRTSRPRDLGSLLLPAVGVAIVAYSDNVLTGAPVRDAQRLRHRRQPGAPRPRCGQPGVRCDAGLPGEQQRQPHCDRRLARQPQPALLAGRAGRGRR